MVIDCNCRLSWGILGNGAARFASVKMNAVRVRNAPKPAEGGTRLKKQITVRVTQSDYDALMRIAAVVPESWLHRQQPLSRTEKRPSVASLVRFAAKHEKDFVNLINTLADASNAS